MTLNIAWKKEPGEKPLRDASPRLQGRSDPWRGVFGLNVKEEVGDQ